MIDTQNFTTTRSLLGGLAKAMDLINPIFSQQHERMGYFTCLLAREMGMEDEFLQKAVYASLLYDVGALMIGYGINESTMNPARDTLVTPMVGAAFVGNIEGLKDIADIIEYCQMGTQELNAVRISEKKLDERLLKCSAAVHLAYKICCKWLSTDKAVLNQVSDIHEKIEELQNRKKEFDDEVLEAFYRLSEIEQVWLELYNPTIPPIGPDGGPTLSLQRTLELTALMSQIVDFRSPFTRMHSVGVAASARKLAEIAGMNETDCMMIEIAGNLHDVGKLMVPSTILEKPGRLTDEEFNIIKEHPYYTRWILHDIEGFETITEWAGNHHEKLNGRGYPRHIPAEGLDLGARILAVADIFSAITEDRPYRKGMAPEKVVQIMDENVQFGAISGEIVELLKENYEEIDNARAQRSRYEGWRYYKMLGVEEAENGRSEE